MKAKIFKPNQADIIYYDGKYQFYKKDAGEVGTFIPGDLFEIISFCIHELGNWQSCGLAKKEDLEEVVDDFMGGLDRLIEKYDK